jgi:hypothetical protein
MFHSGCIPLASSQKKPDQTSVIVMASQLKQMFAEYIFENHEEQKLRSLLLRYIPEKCNYTYNPQTYVAELALWHRCRYSLRLHMNLFFCSVCEIQIAGSFLVQLQRLLSIQTKILGFRPLRICFRSPESISATERFLLHFNLV